MPNYKKYSELQVGDVVKDGQTFRVVTATNKKDKIIEFGGGYTASIGEQKIEVIFESNLSSPSCQCKKEEWKPEETDYDSVINEIFKNVGNPYFIYMNGAGQLDICPIRDRWSGNVGGWNGFVHNIFKENNFYHTRQEAESALEQIKSKLKEIKDNG